MRRLRHPFEDGEIAGVEFGDPVKPYGAVWLHATGFNAMTYQSILAPLGFRARVAALDMRGHGRTTLATNPRKLVSWRQYRDDVIAWMDKYAPGGAVLGGHSMGGCVALMVAGKRPDLVRGLVLVDPVVLDPRFYFWAHVFPPMNWFMRGGSHMARQARRRRRRFDSLAAAKASYRGRGAFKSWREPFLDDYLHDGIDRVDDNTADSEDAAWELLCDPKWEAATFAAQRNRPWAALSRVRRRKIPVTILRAEHGSVLSDRVTDKLTRKLPAMVLKRKRGSSHFLPMEAPYEVRDLLSSYISRLVEGFSASEEGPVQRSLSSGERWTGN